MRKTFGFTNPNSIPGEYLNTNNLHYESNDIRITGANFLTLLTTETVEN